jgi:hypothetical protein
VFGIRNSPYRLIVHLASIGVIHCDRNCDASPERFESVEQVLCTEIKGAVVAAEFVF